METVMMDVIKLAVGLAPDVSFSTEWERAASMLAKFESAMQHHEIWKHYQSTGQAHVQVLESLIVCRTCWSARCCMTMAEDKRCWWCIRPNGSFWSSLVSAAELSAL